MRWTSSVSSSVLSNPLLLDELRRDWTEHSMQALKFLQSVVNSLADEQQLQELLGVVTELVSEYSPHAKHSSLFVGLFCCRNVQYVAGERQVDHLCLDFHCFCKPSSSRYPDLFFQSSPSRHNAK